MTRENRSSGFPTCSETNQAEQLQKMARGLKFQIYKVEGLYYLCSENKGADQKLAKNRFSHDAAQMLSADDTGRQTVS